MQNRKQIFPPHFFSLVFAKVLIPIVRNLLVYEIIQKTLQIEKT